MTWVIHTNGLSLAHNIPRGLDVALCGYAMPATTEPVLPWTAAAHAGKVPQCAECQGAIRRQVRGDEGDVVAAEGVEGA